MSEYPEDVMKVARECADLCLYTTDDRMALHIARAIMAERLRCADVVLNANALNADERYFLRQIARKIVNQPSSAVFS